MSRTRGTRVVILTKIVHSTIAPFKYLDGETEQNFLILFIRIFFRDAHKTKIVRENFCEIADGVKAEADGGAIIEHNFIRLHQSLDYKTQIESNNKYAKVLPVYPSSIII